MWRECLSDRSSPSALLPCCFFKRDFLPMTTSNKIASYEVVSVHSLRMSITLVCPIGPEIQPLLAPQLWPLFTTLTLLEGGTTSVTPVLRFLHSIASQPQAHTTRHRHSPRSTTMAMHTMATQALPLAWSSSIHALTFLCSLPPAHNPPLAQDRRRVAWSLVFLLCSSGSGSKMNDVLNQDHQPEELRRVRVDMGTLDRVSACRGGKREATTPRNDTDVPFPPLASALAPAPPHPLPQHKQQFVEFLEAEDGPANYKDSIAQTISKSLPLPSSLPCALLQRLFGFLRNDGTTDQPPTARHEAHASHPSATIPSFPQARRAAASSST